MLIRFLLITLFTCIFIQDANADPVSLVATGVTALLSSSAIGLSAGLAGTLGNLIAGGLVLGGSIAASAFLGGAAKSRGRLTPSQAKETVEIQESEELNAFGRVRIGGALLFANTNNKNRYRLIANFKGTFDKVEAHFINGREVFLRADNKIMSPPFTRQDNTPGGTGFYSSYGWLKNKQGNASNTAWTELTAAFPTYWTADHKVNGISQTLINIESPGIETPRYLKVFSEGYPKYEMVVRANNQIYDPRTDSTKWTDNGVLIAAHYLSLDDSIGFDKIDWDMIAIEADKADALVATKTGTEPRARAWGVFASEETRSEVISDILRSIGGQIIFDGNKHYVRLIDDDRPSEFSIENQDILGFELAFGMEAIERPNRCRVKYYSSERNYEITEIDLTGVSWAKYDDEILKYGEKLIDIELRFCPSASQAQRIARRLFAEARAESGSLTTNMVGLNCWDKTVIEVNDLETI